MDDPRFELRAGMDRLRGRLFECIELADLSEKKERAFKGVVRSITYDAQATLEGALNDVRRTEPHRD